MPRYVFVFRARAEGLPRPRRKRLAGRAGSSGSVTRSQTPVTGLASHACSARPRRGGKPRLPGRSGRDRLCLILRYAGSGLRWSASYVWRPAPRWQPGNVIPFEVVQDRPRRRAWPGRMGSAAPLRTCCCSSGRWSGRAWTPVGVCSGGYVAHRRPSRTSGTCSTTPMQSRPAEP
jgi:hypothetical protein